MKKLAKEIWIVGAKRTAFGAMNGAFKGVTATELGAHAGKAAVAQSGVAPADFDHVIVGNVLQTQKEAIFCARHVGLRVGLPIEVPALTVNRLCGSGFQAVISAAEQILLGDAKAVLAAGTENMTQAPHVMYGLRDGQKYGRPPVVIDSLSESLVDSLYDSPMGISAENLAAKYSITRDEADAFAVRSQQKWAAANAAGRFADEITPVTVKLGRKEAVISTDEHPRPTTTVDDLAKLPTVFKKDGVVTAGSASGICDGAAALVVVDGEWGKAQGLEPLAKIVQWGIAGVDPTIMGIGPAPAIRSALTRAGMTMADVDLFDVNEAFATQFLSVQKELELPEERTNVNGGAIALGHPLGASGARITTNLIYTAKALGKNVTVGAACIGGGQGIAIVLENA
jgi:acetyl-CoA C-acetyltransferase/acetyl-CoA acyltransferase 2